MAKRGARAIAENLTQLTSLYLSNNRIGNAGTRAIAENLAQLTSLYLRSNGIGDAAIRVIAEKRPSLRVLNLAGNKKITSVAALGQLSQLSSLDISETAVADLSDLKRLVLNGLLTQWDNAYGRPGLYVKNCPLVHPSPEIVQQGPAAVLNYFREIEAQGVDRLYEAKVLILGEGGAGKTSLLRRLYQSSLSLPKEDETTRGIAIHCHEFSTAQNRTFRLNIWDFGGQQIYHATHQFFLTKNSLYVLVDDTRKDDKSIHDDSFKYWLEVVEVLSDSSPLLIFQNEKGGRSKTIDIPGIKGRFPNVKETYGGDLEKPGVTNRIKSDIEYFVQQLPHIGEEVPAKWVVIRKAVEEAATAQPFISLEAYFEIYRKHLEFDRAKALHLSRYLHDLGVFLHFQDDPLLRRTVILQNHWATEAVFRMLDDEIVKRNFGRFNRQDCERLWAESLYAEMHPELLSMMVKFELCYPLSDTTDDAWLAPQLLSPSKPPQLAEWKSPSDLTIRFRYAFLPKGLVSRLMVRMHRFVKRIDLAWTHGVLFERHETQVLVEATDRGNEIELRARGPENKALLSVIASALEGLNDSFKGLEGKVSQWVSCVCEQCAKDPSPEIFELARLIKRKQDGKYTIECPKSYADVSVLELLDGLKLDQLPAWAKEANSTNDQHHDEECDTPMATPTKETTVRIFLASSAELRADRDDFELYFRQQNDRLRTEGLYLQIVRWENFLDAMSETRLQDEYNKEVRQCDIFVSLFKTKTGKFTKEEFETAYGTFLEAGKPLIYTFFKDAQVSTDGRNQADLKSLWAFREKLEKLGHFPTNYSDIEHLKRQFRDQLDKLRETGRI